MQCVLDASVVIKFLVEEAGSAQALALLDRAEKRIAPDWISVEVAAALWNKVKYSKLLAVHAERSLQDFPRFLHRLLPCQPLLADSFQLAIRLQHPVYDCLYLALAMNESARLVTADKKFHARVVEANLEQHVELLTW
jgi:predicted nucleic acid-binding protein